MTIGTWLDLWRMIGDLLRNADPTWNPHYPLLEAVARYFAFVILDGDYLNDWLTHMPHFLRVIVESVGRLYVQTMGL